MKDRSFADEDAARMFPLLRSIGREIRARVQRKEQISERIEALSPTRQIHEEDIRNLETELSTQMRELRSARKELERLGCRMARSSADRILIPGDDVNYAVDGFLGNTRFVRVRAD